MNNDTDFIFYAFEFFSTYHTVSRFLLLFPASSAVAIIVCRVLDVQGSPHFMYSNTRVPKSWDVPNRLQHNINNKNAHHILILDLHQNSANKLNLSQDVHSSCQASPHRYSFADALEALPLSIQDAF
jgi:hypothetical protein